MRRVHLAPVLAGAALTALLLGSCSSKSETPTTTTASGTPSTTATPATTGAPAKEGTLTLSSKSFNRTFPITSCNNGDETDLVIEAEDAGITATVTAWGGSGAVKVDGGSEADGVTVNGVLDTVEVGDTGEVNGAGTLGEPNFAGEEFTLRGSCAGVDASPTTTAPDSKAVEEASKAELEEWQKDLNIVACYAGAIDGTLGPRTESAVKAFQAASSLAPDGVLGPKTKAALKEAAAAKRVVCASTSTDGTASTKAVLKVASPSYDKTFVIGSCSSSGETAVKLNGQADNLTVTIDATNGTGSLSISGASETDGITLKGDVTSVTVGDTGDVLVEGTFTAPNFSGEKFTVTGSCA